MENLKFTVSLIQSDLKWEDGLANRHHIERRLDALSEPADLILLPEMFPSGFTMNPVAVAEPMDGETVNWMLGIARKHDAAICGSLVIVENGQYFNRLLFVRPNGKISQYDKRHLFSFAGENRFYQSGRHKVTVEFRGWKICPLVCYDLRFPVFSRNTDDYDLLLYVANWPDARIGAWDALLKARAIENMCYAAGVNRVGQDGNGHRYTGHSNIYDCFGNALAGECEDETNLSVSLDRTALRSARDKFAFLDDRDQFTVM
jgi:predicted amidohydrolase